MNAPLLKIEQLSIEYGSETILQPFDWTVQPGERWAILGANGTGKTSLLHELLGLYPKLSAHVSLSGQRLNQLSTSAQAAQRVWVPQRYDEPFTLTVLQAVMSLAPEIEAEKIMGVLAEFGLSHVVSHWVHTLSGGERQRLTWAMSVARTTEQTTLWLLDEPLAAQDLGWQMRLLQRLKTSPTAVIAAIHDLNHVTRFATHVLLIKKEKNSPARVLCAGEIASVMQPELLSDAFGVDLQLQKNDNSSWWQLD